MNNQNFDKFLSIPSDILEAAQKVGDYMTSQGYIKWELGNLCSRNFADQCKVYENFFKFKKDNNIK